MDTDEHPTHRDAKKSNMSDFSFTVQNDLQTSKTNDFAYLTQGLLGRFASTFGTLARYLLHILLVG